MSWSNRYRDWKNANSLFKRRFRGRRGRGILISLLTSNGNIVQNWRKYWSPRPPIKKLPHRTWAVLSCVLFIVLHKVVITLESVDVIFKCDHSNESYWAERSCGAVCYAVQGGSNFRVCGWNPKLWPFKWKLLSSTFLWYCLSWYAVWF